MVKKKIGNDGCLIYVISKKGECYSTLAYKQGSAHPGITFKYFEAINDTTYKVIPEFEPNEFYKDSLINRKKKYIFFILSGYENYRYIYEYHVDYGFNHKKYNNW
jgi:hypothetical protein